MLTISVGVGFSILVWVLQVPWSDRIAETHANGFYNSPVGFRDIKLKPMKYIITSLLLILLNLKGSSQQIGKTYSEIVKYIAEDNTLYNTKTVKEKDFYYIQVDSKSDAIILETWYFDYTDGKCYAARIFYTKDVLNDIVKNLNVDYVSTGELTWKDYKSNLLLSIKTEEEFFVLQVNDNSL